MDTRILFGAVVPHRPGFGVPLLEFPSLLLVSTFASKVKFCELSLPIELLVPGYYPAARSILNTVSLSLS